MAKQEGEVLLTSKEEELYTNKSKGKVNTKSTRIYVRVLVYNNKPARNG